MSKSCDVLHSHSALERELKFPKHTVLVDEEFGDMFPAKTPFEYKGVKYFKVRTIDFVNKWGTFKNLME